MEYQRIKFFWHGLDWLCPGASTAVCVPFGGVGCVERGRGVVGVGLCLAHCWVLRQQDLFAAMQGGTSGVSFVPASGTAARVHGSPFLVGVVVGGGLVDGVVV